MSASSQQIHYREVAGLRGVCDSDWHPGDAGHPEQVRLIKCLTKLVIYLPTKIQQELSGYQADWECGQEPRGDWRIHAAFQGRHYPADPCGQGAAQHFPAAVREKLLEADCNRNILFLPWQKVQKKEKEREKCRQDQEKLGQNAKGANVRAIWCSGGIHW